MFSILFCLLLHLLGSLSSDGLVADSTPLWQEGDWAYEWQGNGMLRSVKRPDGEVVSFEYDPLGRRISKTFQGKTTHWVWDGNVPLHEWTDIKTVTTWLFDEGTFIPTAKIVGDKSYSVVTDYLGTPTHAFDSNGAKVWERNLDIYGRVKVGDSTFVPFQYQGQYFDEETDLCYNRFRYYSPDEGMYISQDPIGLAGTGLNVYAYAKNINEDFDLFGLECWSTARKNFWKQEAIDNPDLYSSNNIARMEKGKAPKMTVEVTNRKTGITSVKDYSLELHHTNTPQRVGGTGVHNASNLKIVDPWQHEAIDPFRHVGSDLDVVIKGVDTW